MLTRKSIAAGIIALSALAAFAPAQAGVAGSGIDAVRGDAGIQTVGHRDRNRSGYHDDNRWHDRRHGHRDWRRRHLSPRQVRRSLRHRGFYNMHFVDRHAPVYKLRATGPRGYRVFLIVSSRTGRIIDRHRIRRWR